MKNKINVLIDFSKGFTIGGLVTLRMEIELIINNLNYDFVNILLKGNYDQKQFEIINHCFKLSLINFSINNFQDYIQIDWPRDKDFKDTYFTYHSTLRVRELSKKYNVFPKINWREDFIQKLTKKLNILDFKNSLILHLKNQKKGSVYESNVNIKKWDLFFHETTNNHSNLSFILIGNDVPLELLKHRNTYCSENFKLNLFEELAASSICKGFLGLASGMSSATIFSKTPYVILKHPNHHRVEMNLELGKNDALSFAKNNQKILRVEQNLINLRSALSILV